LGVPEHEQDITREPLPSYEAVQKIIHTGKFILCNAFFSNLLVPFQLNNLVKKYVHTEQDVAASKHPSTHADK